MRRRALVAALGAAALARLPAVRAQPSGKVWQIGMLETAPAEQNAANLAAFRAGMRELGYVEGRNLVIAYRSGGEGRVERFRELADELLAIPVDLIVVRGTPATRAAQGASAAVPIVMAAAAEPLRSGVVESLSRPGANVTGLSAFTIELVPKLIELLREIVPGATRVAVLNNLINPVAAMRWELAQSSARALGMTPVLLDVRTSEDIAPAFAVAVRERADGVITGVDALLRGNRQRVVDLAARHRLPTLYPSREFVDAGGLASYGADFPQLYFRAASFVDKIFKGAKPGDLPVEQPSAVEMAINLRTARALGLTIPQAVLLRADVVIE